MAERVGSWIPQEGTWVSHDWNLAYLEGPYEKAYLESDAAYCAREVMDQAPSQLDGLLPTVSKVQMPVRAFIHGYIDAELPLSLKPYVGDVGKNSSDLSTTLVGDQGPLFWIFLLRTVVFMFAVAVLLAASRFFVNKEGRRLPDLEVMDASLRSGDLSGATVIWLERLVDVCFQGPCRRWGRAME